MNLYRASRRKPNAALIWLNMKITIQILLFSCIFVMLGMTRSAHAEQRLIGARPLGMGEAFSSVADDNNALFWNPAGLPTLGHHEATFSNVDLFGIGLDQSSFGYVFPLTDSNAIGFDWTHQGYDDSELGYYKNYFGFSYGRKVWNGLSIGSTVRYLNTDISLDSKSMGKGAGWGLDAGLLLSLYKNRLKFGLNFKDITSTKIEFDGGSSEVLDKPTLRFGTAFQATRNLLVVGEIDNERVHLGGEYWYRSMFGLRAGIQDDLHTDEVMTASFGTSIHYKFLKVDYAYVIPPTLPATHYFTLSFFYNLYQSKIKITDTSVNNVFPALYKQYSRKPFGKVKIVNTDTVPHEASIGIFIPELMSSPTENKVIIRPKETKEIALNGIFSHDINNLRDDILTQAEIKVSYTEKQKTRSHKKTSKLFVYNRNAITWDDLGKIGAFVTSTDPKLDTFVRTIMVQHEEKTRALGRSSRNILKAMVLFDSLVSFGIRYIPDPNNPFTQMSEDRSAVDNVQYPVEVLAKKSGDCDDLVALYCALLENIGIQTAVVDAPGHVFMMFDSGVSSDDADGLPIQADLYIEKNGKIWIPVEITLVGSRFMDAWRAGIGECRSMIENNRFNTIQISDAWQDYEPSLIEIEKSFGYPLEQEIQNVYLTDLSDLKEVMHEFINDKYNVSHETDEDAVESGFNLAYIYSVIKEFDKSLLEYEKLLTLGAEESRVYNNMGITYYLMNDRKQSAISFKKAMDIDPADEGIKRNFAMALSALSTAEKEEIARELNITLPTEIAPVVPPENEDDGTKESEFEIDEGSFNWNTN
jgi:tetratricopeptide (TPR) repeat protein